MTEVKNMNSTRRDFLRKSSLAVAGFTIVPRFVLGRGFTAPSDKITLGIIGLGKQGLMLNKAFLKNTQAQIVAGSDVWDTKRALFESQVKEHYAELRGVSKYKGVTSYLEYRDLLERSDIDAVIVATPDHWHAIQSIDAMKAGKDLYCEKPMTLTLSGGKKMVKVARKNGTIVQIGSMQRSWDKFKKAQQIVSSGRLGDIKKILVSVGDPDIPYDLEKQDTPEGVDWNRWCGPAPMISYHQKIAPSIVKHFPKWRNYKETGGGILADWGAHMFDIAQWCIDMDHSGPIKYIPPQDRTAVRGLKMLYANGIEMFHEEFGRKWGVRFMGSEGSMDVSRKYLESSIPGLLPTSELENQSDVYGNKWNHYQDWISAIKTRKQPICPIEIGHRSASICNIANIAYDLGRPLNWDPIKEVFIDDPEANKMQKRKIRKY